MVLGSLSEIVNGITSSNTHYLYGIILSSFYREYVDNQLPKSAAHDNENIKAFPQEAIRIKEKLDRMHDRIDVFDARLTVIEDAFRRKSRVEEEREIAREVSLYAQHSKELSNELFEVHFDLNDQIDRIGASFSGNTFNGSAQLLYQLEGIIDNAERKLKPLENDMRQHISDAEACYSDYYGKQKNHNMSAGSLQDEIKQASRRYEKLQNNIEKANKQYEALSERLSDLYETNQHLMEKHQDNESVMMSLREIHQHLFYEFLPSVNHEDSPIYLEGVKKMEDLKLHHVGDMKALRTCELSMILDQQLACMKYGIQDTQFDVATEDRRELYEQQLSTMKKGLALLEKRADKIERFYEHADLVERKQSQSIEEGIPLEQDAMMRPAACRGR